MFLETERFANIVHCNTLKNISKKETARRWNTGTVKGRIGYHTSMRPYHTT